jgi:hypothetical protein
VKRVNGAGSFLKWTVNRPDQLSFPGRHLHSSPGSTHAGKRTHSKHAVQPMVTKGIIIIIIITDATLHTRIREPV